MVRIIVVFLILGLFSVSFGKCRILSEDKYKEKAYNLYLKALKLYEENKLKEAYRSLKEATSLYYTRNGYLSITYECSKLVPGAFLPIRKKYLKEIRKDYDVYTLMRKLKFSLYPKIVVILKLSYNRLRVSVYNVGSPTDTLPADNLKVIVENSFGKTVENLGDLEAGKKKEITIKGNYDIIKIEESFGFNPFPISLKVYNEVD